MKAIFGALAATALAALPLSAMAQHHVLYGARPAPHAAPVYHAPVMRHGYGHMPTPIAYRPMNVARHVYAMNRAYGMQHADHRFDHRDYDNRFEHRFDDRDFARNEVRDHRFHGAYDAGYATIQIGGDYGASYAGDYGDDSTYAGARYDAGYADRGYDTDQDSGYASRDYGYRSDDRGYDRDDDRGDWSAGAPPADCGRWVWRDYANRYQWVAAACPCPGYDDDR